MGILQQKKTRFPPLCFVGVRVISNGENLPADIRNLCKTNCQMSHIPIRKENSCFFDAARRIIRISGHCQWLSENSYECCKLLYVIFLRNDKLPNKLLNQTKLFLYSVHLAYKTFVFRKQGLNFNRNKIASQRPAKWEYTTFTYQIFC